MTQPEQDDPVLLLAEAIVESVRTQRAEADARRTHDAAVLDAMRDMVEAVRSLPATVVNMEPVVVPPAEVRIEPAFNIPPVQNVRIVGLPRLSAKVTRDRQGRLDGIEES